MVLTRANTRGPLRRSEGSDAHFQVDSCKEQQNDEDESAKDGNYLEQLAVNLDAGRTGKTSCNRGQARAWRKTSVGSHRHLRYLGTRERGLRPSEMAAPRYGSISAIGNRVTVVTFRAHAGSVPAPPQVLHLRKASAALRKFLLRSTR